MSEDVIFYTNPRSRGRIARWMLEEAGCPYRTEIVDFGPAMKAPDCLAVNPIGKVPAIRHGGAVVTECAAICAYLADAFPRAGLAPPPAARGSYCRWLFFAAGPLEAAATNHALGFEPAGEKQGMVGYGAFAQVMDTLERSIPAKGYIAGERFSAADVYLGSHIGWGMSFGAIEKRPAFERYFERISTRPAAIQAREIDDALIANAKQPASDGS